MNFSYFLITILFSKFLISNQENHDTDEPITCGQYGFRCINEIFFQICTYPDLDGQTEQPEVIHECQDKNVCDEDNPAYCSPPNTIADFLPTNKNSRRKIRNKNLKNVQRQSLRDNNPHGKDLRNLDIQNLADNYIPKTFVQNKNEINTTTFLALRKRKETFNCKRYGFFAGNNTDLFFIYRCIYAFFPLRTFFYELY